MEISFYQNALQKRTQEHCFRKIPYPKTHNIDLASNDYLRLSHASNLIKSAKMLPRLMAFPLRHLL